MKELDKMSKKEKREYFKRFRNLWEVNPVSRKENKNKYKEKKYNEKYNTKTF